MSIENKTQIKEKPLDKNLILIKELKESERYVNNNPELRNLQGLLSNIPTDSIKVLAFTYTFDKIVDTSNINKETNKDLFGLKKELEIA